MKARTTTTNQKSRLKLCEANETARSADQVTELEPQVTFGACFSEMFLNRISDLNTFAPLHATDAYQEARAAYEGLFEDAFDEPHDGEPRPVADEVLSTVSGVDPIAVEALMRAVHRMQDLEMEYIYRLGIQDGARLDKPGFLVDGLA
jgi:hypothetical protein